MLIAITARDEIQTHLDRTIESVTGHLPGHEVVVMDDKSMHTPMAPDVVTLDGIGLGVSRDTAIRMAAQRGHTHVMLMDAHMRVDDSTCRAIDAYLDSPLIDPKTDLACMRCDAIDDDWQWGEVRGYGARVKNVLADKDKQIKRLFESQWNNGERYATAYECGLPSLIGSLLGACYIIPVHHYLTTLCRPWQCHKGWGTSEATVSLPHGAMGGKIWCLPGRAGHLFGTTARKESKTVQRYVFHHWMYRYNQLRLAYALFGVGTGLDHLAKSRHNLTNYALIDQQADKYARRDKWKYSIREAIEDKTCMPTSGATRKYIETFGGSSNVV